MTANASLRASRDYRVAVEPPLERARVSKFIIVSLLFLSCRTMPSDPELRAAREQRHPCDMMSSVTRFVADAGLCDGFTCGGHCGDGRRAWSLCESTVAGGCGQPLVHSERCTEQLEECDKDQLGSATCESLGFRGGRLACRDDCTFELGGCDQCPALAGARCAQAVPDGGHVAAFTLDGRDVLVAEERAEQSELWRLSTDGGRTPVLTPAPFILAMVPVSKGMVLAVAAKDDGTPFLTRLSNRTQPVALPRSLEGRCLELRSTDLGALVLTEPSCGGTFEAAQVSASGAVIPFTKGRPVVAAVSEKPTLALVATGGEHVIISLSQGEVCRLETTQGMEAQQYTIPLDAVVTVPVADAGVFIASGVACSGRWRVGSASVVVEANVLPPTEDQLATVEQWKFIRGDWVGLRGNTVVVLPRAR